MQMRDCTATSLYQVKLDFDKILVEIREGGFVDPVERLLAPLTEQPIDPHVEQAAYLNFLEQNRAKLSVLIERDNALDVLRDINMSLTGLAHPIRNSWMDMVHPDGTRIRFPHPADSRRIISDGLAFAKAHLATRPMMAAVAVYASIIQAHLFIDGNGRLARLIFNLIACQGHCERYVPLKTIERKICAQYTLAIRRCVYFGEWPDLLRYFERAVSSTMKLKP
jgi:Fic/DOC family